MTKKILQGSMFIVIGCLAGLLLAGFGSGTLAQFTSPPDSHGTMFLANHHKEVQFTLSLGQTREIPLPKTDAPVRIEYFISGSTVTFGGSPPAEDRACVSWMVVAHDTVLNDNLPRADSISSCGGSVGMGGFKQVQNDVFFDVQTGNIKAVSRLVGEGMDPVSTPVKMTISMWY